MLARLGSTVASSSLKNEVNNASSYTLHEDFGLIITSYATLSYR